VEITNKKILTITLSVIVIHFILTSIIGHYIAVQIGVQTGQIVTSGLEEASKSHDAADEESTKIYQNMKKKVDVIDERWKIPRLLISLPAKPLMNSFLREIKKNQLNMVIAKEITREQFVTRGLIIDYTANFLNSLSLGFIVYIVMRILKSRAENIESRLS
jgi:cell division protein FtsB